MGVQIRLSRFGCKHRPFYRVMVADSRSPRDGKHLDILGFYNPLTADDDEKRMALNSEKVKHWVSVGAQPSKAAQRLLLRAGLLPPQAKLARGGPVDPITGKDLKPEDYTFAE